MNYMYFTLLKKVKASIGVLIVSSLQVSKILQTFDNKFKTIYSY